MRKHLWSTAALLVMVFFAFGSTGGDKSSNNDTDNPSGGGSSGGGSPRKGEAGYISVEGESTVWVAIDEKAQDELTSFSRAKNEAAIRQMMQQGRVLVCAKRTKVTIVDPGFLTTTIRIMEGKHEGQTGIVPNEWVHK